ncbi:hypothetical protein BDV12DRAFT_202496 [Aspergillus spectabilis]
MHIRPARPKPPRQGLLHEYAEGLVAFEYSTNKCIKSHTLLFVGGLGDGLGTVAYLTDIVAALEETEWSIFAPILSSSYGGWGTTGLGRDIDEIALCVEYILQYKRQSNRKYPGPNKIVIMGHSTGSQDVMQYISTPNPRHPQPSLDRASPPVLRPQVDGAIMQAPVSDREAIQWVLNEGTGRHTPEQLQQIYNQAITRAKQNPFENYDSLDTIVPLAATASLGYPASTAVSSRRFLSLASPDGPRAPGEDDLFSSDLSYERLKKTFGMVHGRGVLKGGLLVIYSGKDPCVPPGVNKEGLLKRWRRVIDAERVYWHRESGIIPGASHTLEGSNQIEQREILVDKRGGLVWGNNACSIKGPTGADPR